MKNVKRNTKNIVTRKDRIAKSRIRRISLNKNKNKNNNLKSRKMNRNLKSRKMNRNLKSRKMNRNLKGRGNKSRNVLAEVSMRSGKNNRIPVRDTLKKWSMDLMGEVDDNKLYMRRVQKGGFFQHITAGFSNLTANLAKPLIQVSMVADQATQVLNGGKPYYPSKTEESKPAESKPEESKPEESKTADSKPAESKTEESKTAESKTEESKTEESKTV